MQKDNSTGTIEQIIKLPLRKRKSGFLFTQDRRNDDACIYKQFSGDTLIGYEVFKVMVEKAREFGGATIPAHERFPSDEAFGSWAWSFYANNYAGALIKFGELTGRKKGIEYARRI